MLKFSSKVSGNFRKRLVNKNSLIGVLNAAHFERYEVYLRFFPQVKIRSTLLIMAFAFRAKTCILPTIGNHRQIP